MYKFYFKTFTICFIKLTRVLIATRSGVVFSPSVSRYISIITLKVRHICAIYNRKWARSGLHKVVTYLYLTHVFLYKMSAILQTTFLMPCLEGKYVNIRLNSLWSGLLGSSWQYFIIGSDNGLTLCRQQAIIWANDVYCRIYASFNHSELTHRDLNKMNDILWTTYRWFSV